MSNTRIFLLFVALLALTACQPTATTGHTASLEARIAALEAQLTGVEGSASAGDVAALTNRVTVLEAQTAMANSGGMSMDHGEENAHNESMEPGTDPVAVSHDSLFPIAMAMHMMDTAGFHRMDETINDTGTLDSTYVTTVNQVARLMSVTPWSPDLAEEAAAFQVTLAEFAAALENEDVEAAKPLATRAHEEQHGFSHSIETWLNGQMGMEGEGDHSH